MTVFIIVTDSVIPKVKPNLDSLSSFVGSNSRNLGVMFDYMSFNMSFNSANRLLLSPSEKYCLA